jgi:hypothetical protein
MNTNKTLFGFYTALLLVSATSVFAQPANDNFDHRTVLSGSPVTFGGSLAGATLESAETNGTSWVPFNATGSLWWTWTAAVTGPVVISMPSAQPSYDVVSIYTGAEINTLTLGPFTSFPKPLGRYLRFDAIAGTTYQIRVAGSDPQQFSFQLTATNQPLFIVQPRDCVVSPCGSAFFSAMATRRYYYPLTTYQWYFNGAPIPGQVFPSLVIHGVTTNQAGTYSVTASNYDGVAQGGSATLTVADTNPVPTLAISPPINPGSLNVTLSGEAGRWYKIESSINLQNWVNPLWLHLTNSTIPLSIQRLNPNHFVRASLDVPTEVCIAQLKQMQWGITLFAIENLKQESDSYSLVDARWYCPSNSNGLLFPCPEGGTYASGGRVIDPPTCTLHTRGHVIPDAL